MRDSLSLQVYGIPKETRNKLQRIAKKKGFRSMSEMIRVYCDKLIVASEKKKPK